LKENSIPEAQKSTGDTDNGEKHENFCLLCGKYTKDKLKPVQIGSINKLPIAANVCPKCMVIINNASRLFREALVEFQKKLKEFEEKYIIVPGMSLPKNIIKFPKKN
jgi:hypothetical protein